MPRRAALAALAGLLVWPAAAPAAEGAPLGLPVWSAVPFALLLGAIALLPLVAEHFWHSNRNRALVAAALALPVAGYLLWLGPTTGGKSTAALLGEMSHYASFIVLLAALYVVSGGVLLLGDFPARPLTNTAFLAAGVVLANLIGTTGASMLLIRPVLRINRQRKHTRHLPVFFIFLVSNLGGLLTPLGDPPLFLGFLNGVPFLWTLSLWPQWLLANGTVLAIFLAWDVLAYRRENAADLVRDDRERQPLRLRGVVNLMILLGVLVAVLFESEQVGRSAGEWLSRWFPCPNLTLRHPWAELVLTGLTILSLLLTPRGLRAANGFGWDPLVEVAVLFAGIFVTMVPALDLLRAHGDRLGVTEPWQFFWLTGLLSGFLDNAPTYLAFGTLAAGEHDFGWLVANRPLVLQAISCGAVFLGALTYVGNGPNFMVKALADQAGYPTPSFLGYLAYSAAVLLPVFVLVTALFFPPW
jgi:Na+/H+ antiporter NhaD/arsenite permease-like protein